MPSLSDCVAEDVRSETGALMDVDDLFALYDLDTARISAVEGSWECVPMSDRKHPKIEGLFDDDYVVDGPSVYNAKGYMIVRGHELKDGELLHYMWFVYEQTV